MHTIEVPTVPWPLTLGFVALVFGLVGLYCVAVWRGFSNEGAAAASRAARRSAAVWTTILLVSAGLSGSGLLLQWAGTPRLLIAPALLNVAALAVALSSLGARVALRTPLWALVGFQAFRLPLELLLHALYEWDAIPVQMTYEGSNLDIVAGVLALVVGAGLQRGLLGPRSAWLASLVGLGLLVNVMRVAVTSLPTPLRQFDAPLVLPLTTPFFWILPVCVGGALMGHVLAIRALLSAKTTKPPSYQPNPGGPGNLAQRASTMD